MEADEIALEKLPLSLRTYNCIKRSNIHTVGAILRMTPQELREVRNLGRRSYDELHNVLIEEGFMSWDELVGPFLEIYPDDA